MCYLARLIKYGNSFNINLCEMTNHGYILHRINTTPVAKQHALRVGTNQYHMVQRSLSL